MIQNNMAWENFNSFEHDHLSDSFQIKFESALAQINLLCRHQKLSLDEKRKADSIRKALVNSLEQSDLSSLSTGSLAYQAARLFIQKFV